MKSIIEIFPVPALLILLFSAILSTEASANISVPITVSSITECKDREPNPSSPNSCLQYNLSQTGFPIVFMVVKSKAYPEISLCYIFSALYQPNHTSHMCADYEKVLADFDNTKVSTLNIEGENFSITYDQ